MSHNTKPAGRQTGFTIIELMIATAVFAVILLVITASILQFSKQYYKGIIASSTQGVSRTLIDEVSRAIEYNSGSVIPLAANNGSQGWCVGTAKRYSFILNKEVTDSGTLASYQARHGLVSDDVVDCTTATPANNVAGLGSLLINGHELLGQHMRLAKFDIVVDGPIYTITVRVIYGDNDLLDNPASPDAKCLSTAGSQYCATSELTTTVRKRVN